MNTNELIWNGPAGAKTQVILAHGAGAPMDSPFMTFFAEEIAAAGMRVARFEFPYMAERRENGKKRPPNGQKILLNTWRTVLQLCQGADSMIIGGKSMGGRMASMIADEMQTQGLICLGYPFYAPGKPEKTRIEHLKELQTPSLIIQGTRDTLGCLEQVSSYRLSEATAVHWLEDGDHSFKPRKSSGRTEAQNWKEGAAAAVEFIQQL
ncbi:MAG: dienelactone hydrolase family protein [SAR324 cluster bacterium]|nr:dienelactone hydrolase family protein [SAR324 cluster bacterium]